MGKNESESYMGASTFWFFLCLVGMLLAKFGGYAPFALVILGIVPLVGLFSPTALAVCLVGAILPTWGLHGLYGSLQFWIFCAVYFTSGVGLVVRLVWVKESAAASKQLVSQEGATDEQQSRFYQATQPRVNFSSIVGMDQVKASLLEKAQDIVDHKNGEAPRNGILLNGEPGNGKTFFAEALAGELKLPFLSASYGDMASKWVNQTTENVVALFASARRQAPCVLFVDEIDSLIPERSGITNADSEVSRTVNTVLTELVNIRGSGVVLVAATNFMDKLDAAASRDGRFDFKVEIPPPDLPARKHLIASGLKKRAPALQVSQDVIDSASARWKGFSVARIDAVIKEIGDQAKRGKITSLDLATLQIALRAVQGRKGNLAEGTRGLADLEMEPAQKSKLAGIAARMQKIEEVEKMGGTVPSGILFHGAAGTGKTSMAKALAKDTGWAFLSVAGNDLLADPAKIDKVLQEARDIRPCIVFIDEADDVLADRSTSAARTVTNKLLTAMDGAAGKTPDVVFVAATNHPDQLDAAALRGGRFTEKVEFILPTAAVVANYVRKWLKAKNTNLVPPLTVEGIGERLEGISIANVEAILQDALNTLVGRKLAGESVTGIGHADFQAALTTVLGL